MWVRPYRLDGVKIKHSDARMWIEMRTRKEGRIIQIFPPPINVGRGDPKGDFSKHYGNTVGAGEGGDYSDYLGKGEE